MIAFIVRLFGELLLPFALHFEREGHFPKPLSGAEERECFELMERGDKAAREKLISHNLRLVAHIVKKYAGSAADTDDLISIGTIGLIKSVGTFDHEKGARFATYAARCVENEILMHFRRIKKLSAEVHFDEPVDVDKNGNSLTLMDIIADDDMSVSDKCELNINLRTLSEKLMTALDDREREIIVMRYGLADARPLTQRETAKKLGISRSYISRLEKRAIEKLRAEMCTGS